MRHLGATTMTKKKTAIQATAEQPTSPSKSSRKGYRSAIVGTIDTLPIVEDKSGPRHQLARPPGYEPRDLRTASADVHAESGEYRKRPAAQPDHAAATQGPSPRDRCVGRSHPPGDAIGPWLGQPNEAFAGLKPIEVIERGEVDRIWQMIFYLRSGIAS